MKGETKLVKELDCFHRKATEGHFLSAFAVENNFIFGDFLLNFLGELFF